jgi:hypothetical protein
MFVSDNLGVRDLSGHETIIPRVGQGAEWGRRRGEEGGVPETGATVVVVVVATTSEAATERAALCTGITIIIIDTLSGTFRP